jgi:ketosteroid isomerase-like protein
MTESRIEAESGSTWEQEIRCREAEACAAFLAADVAALEQLWVDSYVVNSPLQQVLDRSRVMGLLQAGRIRHSAYEYEIEHMSRFGDVVVVMGNDQVADPPDGAVSKRRFTNVWRLEDGRWRSIARHAHVVSREVS